MKIIFLLDQIQAGLGGKEHGDQPLGGQKTAIGSVKMFEKLLKFLPRFIVVMTITESMRRNLL